MSEWNEARLLALIREKQEENSFFEYKAAAALELNDKNRRAIRKDIAAMANAGGGVIIYGMAEEEVVSRDTSGIEQKRKIPTELQNVALVGTATDTIYQLLDSVQRRIEGVAIETVECPSINGVVYVVSIPESTTIHMPDTEKGSYPKRVGNHVTVMEDYEVRMGLNRSVHPRLEIEFRWGESPTPDTWGSGWITGPRLTCRLRHTGGPLAEKVALDLRVPRYWTESPNQLRDDGLELQNYSFSSWQRDSKLWVPLFPTKAHEFHIQLRKDFWHRSGNGGAHTNESFEWSFYADSASPQHGIIKGSQVPHERS